MKTLFFEGAGVSEADISRATIGNCRIRTAFHLDDGQHVYLELHGTERVKKSPASLYLWQYTGFVLDCFEITDDVPNDDANRHRFPPSMIPRSYEYSEPAIMEVLHPTFRAVFTLWGEDDRPKQYPDHYELTTPEGVKIPLNSLNGYQRGCVLADCERYYVGKTHFDGGESPLGVVKIEDKSD